LGTYFTDVKDPRPDIHYFVRQETSQSNHLGLFKKNYSVWLHISEPKNGFAHFAKLAIAKSTGKVFSNALPNAQ
jgi:hypothetical protein